MTNPDYTHITILADRTGSMGALSEAGRTRAADTTTGIHELIREQAKLPGKLTVSLVQFMAAGQVTRTEHYQTAMYRQVNHIDRVAWLAGPHDSRLSQWTCAPYGNTPLLDAVGTVITDTGQALAEMPEHERPGKVVFVIATDGEENSSTEYTLDSIKRMVTTQQDTWKWQFVFIGVEIDAFADAGKMAFASAGTMGTAAAGITQTYSVTSDAIGRYRGGQSAGVAYTEDEREQVKNR